jgi:cytochrome c553
MPASSFRHFSDEDVMAIVAYLRSQPAVEPDTPPLRLNVLGAVLVNIAPIFEAQAPITEPVLGPPGGVTREYGGYLASLTCMSCHGEDLGGNLGMGAPGLIGVGLT